MIPFFSLNLKKKIFLILLFFIVEFFSSCGLKTPPENIPEKKSKSTIDNLNPNDINEITIK